VLQPIRHLLVRPKCFRLGRASSVGIFTRGFNVPYQGAHNNLSERTLRMVAVGRNNWLFFGADSGGERAAIIYSLVASCKLCKIDPFAYFRDVLERINTHPASRIIELTPPHWKLLAD
jgi:transposase